MVAKYHRVTLDHFGVKIMNQDDRTRLRRIGHHRTRLVRAFCDVEATIYMMDRMKVDT